MKQPIPKWITKEKEYPLMKLVREGVFPGMQNYTTVLNNLIEPDIIKHRVVKRFDSDKKERTAARRYHVYGWSLIEYLKNYHSDKSQVVEIREEVPEK